PAPGLTDVTLGAPVTLSALVPLVTITLAGLLIVSTLLGLVWKSRQGRVVAQSGSTISLTDCIITSAQVPGRPAPILVTEQAVAAMKRGSVVVDLAGANGGNCALTQPGDEVEVNGVRIISPLNLAATVPLHASQLYSRNLTSFLSILVREGQLNLDFNDDIIGPACAVHAGEVVEPRVAALFTT
ncbi:MAG: hypothetical protein EBZ36_10410, partial [Acidobacteria bacterium]|nr:hypothetical protein [Acidobacteriota bacterium]